MPALKKLKLAVKTASDPYAGTDAKVYLVFCGANAGRVYLLPTRKGDLETGQVNVYDLSLEDGPDLEEVTAVLLVNGMTGQNPGWEVLWVKLDVVDDAGRGWRIVDAFLDRWLDAKQDCGPVALLPLAIPFKELSEVEIGGATRVPLRSIC